MHVRRSYGSCRTHLPMKDRQWQGFVAWCKDNRLRPLPAHPWTVAVWLQALNRTGKGADAEMALKSISRAHLLSGKDLNHRHPTITKTLDSIRRCRETQATRADLFDDADVMMDAPAKKQKALPAKTHDISRDRPAFGLRTRPRLVSKRVSKRESKRG